MLIRLIYFSVSVGPQTGSMTHSILKTSQAWNKAHEITGVLCQSNGVFLQALEGERSAVTKLYARIYEDRRHSNIEMIHCECSKFQLVHFLSICTQNSEGFLVTLIVVPKCGG